MEAYETGPRSYLMGRARLSGLRKGGRSGGRLRREGRPRGALLRRALLPVPREGPLHLERIVPERRELRLSHPELRLELLQPDDLASRLRLRLEGTLLPGEERGLALRELLLLVPDERVAGRERGLGVRDDGAGRGPGGGPERRAGL